MTLKMTLKIYACMKSNYNNYIMKATYYSGFSTLMDWKKRDGKKKITIHEYIKRL